MTFVYVDNENFNDELSSYNCQSSCDPAPLQILPCDEVPGVSEYVEVSSAQARRYKLTRKRRATSPIDFIYANDTAYQQSINKTIECMDGAENVIIVDSGIVDESDGYLYCINDRKAYSNEAFSDAIIDDNSDLISRQIVQDGEVIDTDLCDANIDESYRILERANALDEEDYVEACEVIQNIEQPPVFCNNRRYRAQMAADQSVRGCVSVSCSSCRLKFFWPPDTLKLHISWLRVPGAGYQPHLKCPICGCYTPTQN